MTEVSNTDKTFIEGVILQMIKDGIIINKKSPNGYDAFYRKLSTDITISIQANNLLQQILHPAF